MSRTIQIKRGLKADLPALAVGELGFTIDTHEVFIGSAAGNVPVESKESSELLVQLESDGAAMQSNITQLNNEVLAMSRGLGQSISSLAILNSTYPAGDTKDHIVAGNVKEVATLTVTAIPSVSSNVTVTLDGVAHTLLANPIIHITTAALASAIRSQVFAGWVTGGTGNVVTFESTTVGPKGSHSFSGGTSGAAGSMVTTTEGEAANFHRYFWSGTAWLDGGVDFFTQEYKEAIEAQVLADFTAAENARQVEYEAAEAIRQADYLQASQAAAANQELYDELLEEGVLQTSINTKLAALELEYAPELTTLQQNDVTMSQQLAESPYKREHHYYVGETQKYTTITAAYNQWVADGKPKATIHILSGIYTETLVILNNVSNPYELSFVGENKKDVIWKSTNGYYKDSPLAYQGEGVIKGITFVADHSANPSYAYSGLSGNVWGDPVGGAYALHVDFAGAGTTLIQDCDLISYQNAGLGCGTRKDQTIALENVNIYSYTEVETGSAEQLGNGGLLYHTTIEAGATNQRLILKNVKVFSENGNPFVYTHYSPDAVGATLEVITSNFASNAVTTRRNLFKLNEGPQPLLLAQNSYGNNVDSLNSIYSSDPIKALALTQPDGKCLQITNWNDVYYGFVMGDGTSLNAPVDGVWFIGYAFTYGYNSYTEQYAWQITSAHEKFKRSKTGGVWGSWERCYETLSEINKNVTNIISTGTDGNCLTVTNLNNATKNGYYLCDGSRGTANTPSSAWYGAHNISFNSSYKVQYAWEIATGAKYKRSYLNAVWGSWAAIVEP